MASTHIDYRKIDYDQLIDKPITRVASSVNPNTLTTAGVYDRGDGNRFIVTVDGQSILQVIEKKDGYETRSSTDGGTTWSVWDTVQFSKSGDIDAEDVNYDNTASELTATDVQAAIDEIDTSVDTINTTITNIQSDITDIQGDITDIKNIVEVETMPTPSEESEGTIIQYKGETTASFTHGYFYECVGDGQDPESFARVRIDVQPAGAGDDHEFITQAAYNALTPAEKAAKVYMIKEEGVPGSGLTAGAGIDITNNTISADMTTAVYDNTTSGATATNVQDAIDEVFQSVSNGKELIADAITDAGVQTSASDSFSTMATNIGLISDIIKEKDIFMPLSFTLPLETNSRGWGNVGDVFYQNKYYSFFYYNHGSSEFESVGMFIKSEGTDAVLVTQDNDYGHNDGTMYVEVRCKDDGGNLKTSFLVRSVDSGSSPDKYTEIDFTNGTYVSQTQVSSRGQRITNCGISDEEKMSFVSYTTMSRTTGNVTFTLN